MRRELRPTFQAFIRIQIPEITDRIPQILLHPEEILLDNFFALLEKFAYLSMDRSMHFLVGVPFKVNAVA